MKRFDFLVFCGDSLYRPGRHEEWVLFITLLGFFLPRLRPDQLRRRQTPGGLTSCFCFF